MCYFQIGTEKIEPKCHPGCHLSRNTEPRFRILFCLNYYLHCFSSKATNRFLGYGLSFSLWLLILVCNSVCNSRKRARAPLVNSNPIKSATTSRITEYCQCPRPVWCEQSSLPVYEISFQVAVRWETENYGLLFPIKYCEITTIL